MRPASMRRDAAANMPISSIHVGLVARGDINYALDLSHELVAGCEISLTLYLPLAHAIRVLGDREDPAVSLLKAGLPSDRFRIRLIDLPRMRDPRSIRVLQRLAQTMRQDRIDVAHILIGPDELWLAVLALLLRDLPVISTMIVPKPNAGERIPFVVCWAIQKLLASASDFIVVNGADQVQIVEQLYRYPSNRMVHIPLSVRHQVTPGLPESVLEEPGTILFFGRAEPHKGLEYLIRAQPLISEAVPEARILISAHGSDLARCRGLIRDLSKFEITDGLVSNRAMDTAFRRASVVALPYLSASTSGVLMTAYSHLKPVVATRVGSIPEYVENGATGILVAPADVEQLAEAIIRLTADDALRSEMKRNIEDWLAERRASAGRKALEAYQRAILQHYGYLSEH